MRIVVLVLALVGCPSPTGATDLDTDDVDADTDTDTDTDTEVPSPWEELTPLPGAGAWPAVGVLGTRIHVIASNTTTHHVFDTAGDGSWTSATPLPAAAYYHGGAAVDGSFYVFGGGAPRAIDSVDRVFVWEAESDTWSVGPPLPTARGYITSAVVDDEILAIGGPNIGGETVNRTLEALDTTEGTWRTASLLPSGTMWPLYSALGVIDGKVYKLGGGIANNPFDTATVYDVSDDGWTALTPVPVRLHGPAGAAVGRSVYVMGGYEPAGITDRVWRYDVDADAWTELEPLPYDLAYSKAVAIDGCIYVVGGFDEINDEASNSLLRWCPPE